MPLLVGAAFSSILLDGAAFLRPLVGSPFSLVLACLALFLSTKCFITIDKGNEGKQHHPRGATGTTPTKEGKVAPHKMREETAGPPKKGNQHLVPVPLLDGAALSSLLLGGAAFPSLLLGGAAFPSLRVGSPFLFVLVYFVLFPSTKCFITTDKEDEGKQHHPKEEVGGTTQKREEKPAAQEKERDKVKWWSILGGGAGCPSCVVLTSASAVDLPRSQ